ncbi:MAG: MarC family protein [Planctomycetota bacterium]|nr:MarC family protein [Planctomycetota bacterium]
MDNELLNFALRAFVMLFAIVDPVGNVPVFVMVTHSLDAAHRRRLAGRVCLIATGVLSVFAVGGTAVLWAFHLSMPAIRIAGGIILLVIALQMLSGRQFHWRRERVSPDQSDRSAGIVPMAIPMMAGPGAMSSVLALSAQASGPADLGAVLLSVLLVCVISYIFYRAAIPLMNLFGRTAMVTFSCVMGLILAALAVQFMLDGLAEAIPSLFAAA